jgi:hypothetical protein
MITDFPKELMGELNALRYEFAILASRREYTINVEARPSITNKRYVIKLSWREENTDAAGRYIHIGPLNVEGMGDGPIDALAELAKALDKEYAQTIAQLRDLKAGVRARAASLKVRAGGTK